MPFIFIVSSTKSSPVSSTHSYTVSSTKSYTVSSTKSSTVSSMKSGEVTEKSTLQGASNKKQEGKGKVGSFNQTYKSIIKWG